LKFERTKKDDKKLSVLETTCYKFGEAAYRVVLNDMNMYVQPNYDTSDVWMPTREKLIVLDLDAVQSKPFDKSEFVKQQADVTVNFKKRLLQWDNWGFKVLSRVSLFERMLDDVYGNCRYYTGVQLHQLVVWVTYKFKIDTTDKSWWYEVDSLDSIKTVSAASILCNVVRCNRFVVQMTPSMILHAFKFRYKRVQLKGIGKKNLNVVAYVNKRIAAAIEGGAVAIRDLFMNSDAGMQGLMMARSDTREIVERELESEPEERSTATTVSLPPSTKRITMAVSALQTYFADEDEEEEVVRHSDVGGEDADSFRKNKGKED